MEALSRREEQEIETAAKTEALKKCDNLVAEFAECARGRTFTIPFACAQQYKVMGECIKAHTSEERLDELKLDYIANRSERGRQAVETLLRQRREKILQMSGRKEMPAEWLEADPTKHGRQPNAAKA